jgi:hypothetical protein
LETCRFESLLRLQELVTCHVGDAKGVSMVDVERKENAVQEDKKDDKPCAHRQESLHPGLFEKPNNQRCHAQWEAVD